MLARCVCITDASLIEGEGTLLVVIPPGTFGNKYSVQLLQFDSGMAVCPKGKCRV
jgi:hypothetical protein